jgi:hypothetical protein
MDDNKKKVWKTIINLIITILTALLTTIGAHAANIVG